MTTALDRPFSDLKVLVVDDQKFIRGLVAQGLKAGGAQVAEAADGFEALTILGIGDQMEGGSVEALKRERPDMFQGILHTRRDIDVVVSDIRMLPMNGLEMLKAIRSGLTYVHRGLPVVIMSAHSDEALIGAAIALDAHGFVAKPVSQKAIGERIKRALSMKINTKPADVYRMLIIPELDSATLETDVGRAAESLVAVIRAGDVAIASGQRAITVKWQEIVLGDVLNENFTTKSGKLVAPAGTRVTEVLMAAVQDLSTVTDLSDTVSIRRKVI
jgi:CheY-like chemotaxis protein